MQRTATKICGNGRYISRRMTTTRKRHDHSHRFPEWSTHLRTTNYNLRQKFHFTASSIKGGIELKQENIGAKPSKTAGDVFLDNLGNIFLTAIALIILSLVRSSKGSTNKMNLRDLIEQVSALDPYEIEDLRSANSELSLSLFLEIVHQVNVIFPDGEASYTEFVHCVKTIIRNLKGDFNSIQLGHLLDRVVLSIMESEKYRVIDGTPSSEYVTSEREKHHNKMNVSLLLVILSLAMNGKVQERVQALYDIMIADEQRQSLTDRNEVASEISTNHVHESSVIEMVSNLQNTCQLVAEAQILESDKKYPFQQYKVGTPVELVGLGKVLKRTDLSERCRDDEHRIWSCPDFHQLLRSRTVCAWGECYVKKRSI